MTINNALAVAQNFKCNELIDLTLSQEFASKGTITRACVVALEDISNVKTLFDNAVNDILNKNLGRVI